MKNKQLIIVTISLLLFLGASLHVFAQKRVLGRPQSFEMPVDYHPNAQMQERFLEQTSAKSRKDPWLVFSDRTNNPVFDKAGGKQIGTIDFRELFWVVEEKEGWIKIVDATVNGMKIENLKREIGWVPKKNMLLWNSGLIDLNTKIHKKALLLNRADDIENVVRRRDKFIVDVYKGPQTSTKEADIRIFSFYYVLKKEGNMLLIGTESILSTYMTSSIVGWIRQSDCTAWDNRVCLEPNYEAAAFAERKANPQRQIRAFGDISKASEYAESGGAKVSEVFWNDDPVKISRDKLAVSNPYRFRGEVVRFPMISVSQSSSRLQYYSSGLIGTIKVRKGRDAGFEFESEIAEVNYATMTRYINDLNYKNQHLNIFFAIEGTACTYAYQQQLINAIRAINAQALAGIPNVRYGVLLYRDLAEENIEIGGTKINRLIEHVSLTPDIDKVIQFLSQAEFQNKQSQDDWTALYHGLSQTLRLADFNERETNIVMLIGCHGDFRANDIRKKDAERKNHPALIEDLTPLYESFSRMGTHLYAVQLLNDNSRSTMAFSSFARAMILDAAKISYNQGFGNTSRAESRELTERLQKEYNLTIPEPNMLEPREADDIPLRGSTQPGRLLKPAAGRSLPPEKFASELVKNVQNSVQFNAKLYESLSAIYIEGKSLGEVVETEPELKYDIGRLLPPVVQFLDNMLRDANISSKDFYHSLDEKYKLFAEVFIPARIADAAHPLVSYSLLMPESDLLEYKNEIRRCLIHASAYPEKRKQLFEVYKSLIEQFSGDRIMKSAEDFTREEVFRIMQGLERSGLPLEVPLNIRIGDIRNERKISNAEIDVLMNRFQEVHQQLENIIRFGENYDFCYVSPARNRYYWIPIYDIF
jgi:hypothetical protein